MLLDVGLVAELGGDQYANFVEYFRSILNCDGRRIAQCLLRFSAQQKCKDAAPFIDDMVHLFAQFKDAWATEERLWMEGKRGLEAKVLPLGDAIRDCLDHVRHRHVTIDGIYAMLLTTTLVLESWQHELDPSLDLLGCLNETLRGKNMVGARERALQCCGI